ncbi:MAG TPA: D-lyxose/D-mannose family sugar isomerase [Steroidobacteraceae bacterium]|nr:D-lyxose/D-mannose family sugar isomerase [Steroidobacteraceae bacterium]
MKRSEINALIDDAIELLHSHQIRLPPFAYWAPAEWDKKSAECDEIRKCKLGWDITDFGSGVFDQVGLVVFTVRNGHHLLAPYTRKLYAEKVLIVRENQHTPMHHHIRKSEDIICRSGGNLLCQVYNKAEDGGISSTDVEVSLDGVQHHVKAGHIFRLMPGASITLTPYLYHEFWAEEGTGTSIVGEVSSVNDDEIDNVFLDPVGRFPLVEEDVGATYKLCTEY